MLLKNNIPFYDASYISLATSLKAPLASEDEDILNVAPKHGVRIMRLKEIRSVLKQGLT